MADTDRNPTPNPIRTVSYETALCIIPNEQQCEDIDSLRSLYDKSYGKWPPHINLIYPFVAPESASEARERIESKLGTAFGEATSLTVALTGAGLFKHRKDVTVFLRPGDNRAAETLEKVRSLALKALGLDTTPCNFHLTIGQAEENSVSAHQYLLDKVNLLPVFKIDITSLAILVREKPRGKGDAASHMRFCGNISLPGSQQIPSYLSNESWIPDAMSKKDLADPGNELDLATELSSPNSRRVQQGTTYTLDTNVNEWISCAECALPRPTALSISSYNVLIDSEYPPARDRDPLVVNTILAKSALADVLVLQEVSDDFLSYLLGLDEVRRAYPYVSNGPPSQANIGPLPSLRNIVILSKWFFRWKFVPFHRRHKGAVVASFPQLFASGDSNNDSLIVAGVHLTCGLTDGSVAAKKVQLQNLLHHLKREHPANPWLIAGDFNLPTSRYTIEEAVKNKSISQETSRTLASTESILSETGLLDAWAAARVEGVDETAAIEADDLVEGEEGATFNPHENALAATISGSPENRPQRYDRILVRSQGALELIKFNQFGLPESNQDTVSVGSDHYGIRAVFKVSAHTEHSNSNQSSILQQCTVHHKHTTAELSVTADLVEALSKRRVFPRAEDEDLYKHAFSLIKEVLLGVGNDDTHSDIPMIVVPVGSYALNIWTPESDIDCLCIGSISSKTFFQLARQRIRRAESQGVRLLRKVEANTGTMLELSVNGVNMDLQYCPAANVVQRWSEFAHLSATDPIFNLPILSLRKLKPIRDLTYIQRTLPSTSSFRLAYHFIKQWATGRGIYSTKFGYFGGIHITLMLSWVCKRIAHDTGSVSAGDLILSFFNHYSHFDWQTEMVYDAFFHKNKPRYQRSTRDAMVILGFHAPNSNIAHTSTVPGLQVLVSELRRAKELLSAPGMTWGHFLAADTPEEEGTPFRPATDSFLTTFESYVKIDIQYWGRALSKGKGLIGWVESRCIALVVDIHKALPYLSARIWPARFAESEANASETYYHGCYLIGLSRSDDKDVTVSKEGRSEAKASLQKTFDRFLTQVQADDKYYDESSSWIGISLAKASDLKGLQLDRREWGDFVPEVEPDSDDEEELDDPEDDFSAPQTSRKFPLRSAPSGTATPVSSTKLRPASDILNRDYIVGYEDRFLGAKETTLEKWKTEQTDEEFIPQHRILYFKKKGEDGGELVWERATRIDKIFGSGLGAGK
ncbi:hypothetical protein N0V90_010032 [Kalmusia sp. IMI 367209]|nr:hypothetical protein N0V90_010032 [Kalmusia sp. IMI 367209]